MSTTTQEISLILNNKSLRSLIEFKHTGFTVKQWSSKGSLSTFINY